MTDHTIFNVRDTSGKLLCPACGYPDYASCAAYDEDGGKIGSAICPCCLWEPGFDDTPSASPAAASTVIASLRNYRKRWKDGPCWAGNPSSIPLNWDGALQLAGLFEIAPNLR